MHLINANSVRTIEELAFDHDAVKSWDDYLAQPATQATVELGTETELDSLAEHIQNIEHILIRLESFGDGRGFSLAHQLRNRLNFKKPIWAKGDLIADQFPHALGCGFDAVLVTEEHLQRQPYEHWTDALGAAPVPYRCRKRSTEANDAKSNLSVTDETIEQLNRQYSDVSTEILVRDIFTSKRFGEAAMVSSFGTESAVLLHMLAQSNSAAPVLFIDTGKLFSQTLEYQKELTQLLGLTSVETLHPDANRLHELDGFGVLHKSDVDSCCHIRKVEPLQKALINFDTWVSGRKSFQNDTRQNMPLFERSGTHIKINPLAKW